MWMLLDPIKHFVSDKVNLLKIWISGILRQGWHFKLFVLCQFLSSFGVAARTDLSGGAGEANDIKVCQGVLGLGVWANSFSQLVSSWMPGWRVFLAVSGLNIVADLWSSKVEIPDCLFSWGLRTRLMERKLFFFVFLEIKFLDRC